MNKLLSMELKRAAKSPILWLGVIAVIAINVYGILLNGYGFKIFTTTFLLENSDLICIILAVLIPLYLGSDFENRTINNKISAGYKRKEIYIVELIVSSISVFPISDMSLQRTEHLDILPVLQSAPYPCGYVFPVSLTVQFCPLKISVLSL